MIKCAPCPFPVRVSTDLNHFLPRVFRTIFVCIAFCFVAALFASFAVAGQRGPSAAGGQAATSAPGSAERKAIANALRQEVKALHGIEVKFVISFLKVKNDWAWIETRPQSPDGKSRYEDIAALLTRVNGTWRVAELTCTEPDNPDCLGAPDYFLRLQQRFPKAPPQIFPDR